MTKYVISKYGAKNKVIKQTTFDSLEVACMAVRMLYKADISRNPYDCDSGWEKYALTAQIFNNARGSKKAKKVYEIWNSSSYTIAELDSCVRDYYGE